HDSNKEFPADKRSVESPSQVFKRAAPFCALLHAPRPPQPHPALARLPRVARARQLGLDGIAITDHNSVAGIREAEAAAGDLIVIPGIEISTRSGHVIAYGVREPILRDLSVRETVERITALGGVAVAAHPYRFWSGLGEPALLEARFSAYETCNARTLRRGNERARARAAERSVGQTGGSDSHFLDEAGRAVTVLEAGRLRADDVVQWIGAGKTRAQGTDRGADATVRYVSKAVGEWLLRGMRRI